MTPQGADGYSNQNRNSRLNDLKDLPKKSGIRRLVANGFIPEDGTQIPTSRKSGRAGSKRDESAACPRARSKMDKNTKISSKQSAKKVKIELSSKN